MTKILLLCLLQFGNIPESLYNYVYTNNFQNFTYVLDNNLKSIGKQIPVNKDSLLHNVKLSYGASNYINYTGVEIKFIELQNTYNGDFSLSTIVACDFYHDDIYSPTVFVILKTNDNKHGWIFYISRKDYHKSDSLSEEEMEMTEKFCEATNGIAIKSVQDTRTSFYIKTINLKNKETSESLIEGASNFDLDVIRSYNKNQSGLYEVTRIYNEYYHFLQQKTTDLRCKTIQKPSTFGGD